MFFFPNSGKFQKQMYKIRPIGDHPEKIWLGSSGISIFWPFIVTGLKHGSLYIENARSRDVLSGNVIFCVS